MANEKNTLCTLREKAENSKDKYRKARETRADFIKKTVLKLDKNDKFLSLSNEEIIEKLASLISYIPENTISENVEITENTISENTKNNDYYNASVGSASDRYTDASSY